VKKKRSVLPDYTKALASMLPAVGRACKKGPGERGRRRTFREVQTPKPVRMCREGRDPSIGVRLKPQGTGKRKKGKGHGHI